LAALTYRLLNPRNGQLKHEADQHVGHADDDCILQRTWWEALRRYPSGGMQSDDHYVLDGKQERKHNCAAAAKQQPSCHDCDHR